MSVTPDASMTLTECQAFIKRRTIDRGFDNETFQDEFMLLVEEVGVCQKDNAPASWCQDGV